MRRRSVSRLIVLVILIVVLSLPGTTHRTAALQTNPGPLEQMLSQVPDGQESRTVIWYGSLADFENALGIKVASTDDFKKLPQTQQVAYLLDVSGKQVYYSAFSGLDHPAEWQKYFGINPFTVNRELTVGAMPDWYAILQGQFSSGSVTQALTTLGYKPSTANNVTIYSLGADNVPASGSLAQLIGSGYDRLIVSDSQIIAAPSTALIQAASATTSTAIIKDAAYSALVHTLENPQTIPDTQLVSAVLFNGPYLIDTVITADPLAASVGKTLPADQVSKLRAELALQNEKLLPRYETAAVGYRRSATARYWVITLVFTDANNAAQASQILPDRLGRYKSFRQQARQLFQGWKISAKVAPSDDQKFQVVTVTLQLPAQTDVAWTQLVMQRDIGFLAAQPQ
jgi:hypothetical protein